MTSVFVIEETHVESWESHRFVLGLASSVEQAEQLILKRHPKLTPEHREECDGGLHFCLRGVGLDSDHSDLYYAFDIRPFDVDPAALEVMELPEQYDVDDDEPESD